MRESIVFKILLLECKCLKTTALAQPFFHSKALFKCHLEF